MYSNKIYTTFLQQYILQVSASLVLQNSMRVLYGKLEKLFIKNKWTELDQRDLKTHPFKSAKKFSYNKDVNNYLSRKLVECECCYMITKG